MRKTSCSCRWADFRGRRFRSCFFKQLVRDVTSKKGKVLNDYTVERCNRRLIEGERRIKIKNFRCRANSNKKMSDNVEINKNYTEISGRSL